MSPPQRPGPSRFFPRFPVSADPDTDADTPARRMAFLRALAEAGMRDRYGGDVATARPGVATRLAHELRVIEEVAYADYFLIVWDIVREAGARGIPVLARGSAADSLVCYCLGISTVCPLWFNLWFERFLNRERAKFSKLADIDLDLPWDQRDEMIAYVIDRWGEDKVAMIGGFNRFHARAAVGDLGKVFGLSEGEVRAFTRRLPWARADAVIQAVSEIPFLERELPLREAPYPEILRLASSLEDVPRHFSMHPCGIVVSREPLADCLPLLPSGRTLRFPYRERAGPLSPGLARHAGRTIPMTQFDMDAVEDLGFVKIDLLGQAGLSVLRDVRAAVKARHGVDPGEARWDDARTWDLIASGNARGVHHIESPAMTSLLVQANCRDMRCLCAIVSVIRPGAADEEKKLAFTRRHQGFEPPEFPHPDLEDCLADTYGLLVYEEHILMVAHRFAGMNLGRADVLRRELVKMKNPEKLIELGREFCRCAREGGRGEEETRHVWEKLVRFHGYMFNKAHSASYAVEAFEGAWLKCRWPADYMAAVLDNERGFYSPLFYILEARRLGIGLLGPDINWSSPRWTVEDIPGPGGAPRPHLRVPLRAIKGLTQRTLARWATERARASFCSVADFLRRVAPPPDDRDRLLDAGALDGFGLPRPDLFWQLRAAPVAADDLFAAAEASPSGPPTPLGRPPDAAERAAREVELMGFPVSLDAFDHFGRDVDWSSYCQVKDLPRFHGQTVHLVGLVVQTRRTHTSKGEVMFFGTLADPTGFVEVTLFPAVFRRCGHLLERGGVVAVRARVDPFDNRRGCTLDVQATRPPRSSVATRRAG